ncbi:MAG: calcineurin-like phosphoesterase family protein [Paludibacter sp.]|nr:calcineurin-like phosphoesterase family protein [Paludibacter sp.]
MKNKFKVLFLLLLGTSISLFGLTNDQQILVQGEVLCNGKGVPSVSVTDGSSVVQTNVDGKYILHTCSVNDFVYYSLPAGYETPIQDGVPLFYAKLDKNKVEQQINFDLKACNKSQVKHAFILWTDTHLKDTEDYNLMKKVVEDVNKTVAHLAIKLPVHGISCGDNVFDQLDYFEKYKQIVALTGLPFYQVIGNHDMDYNNRSNELSDKSFSEKFGPTHYSFTIGKIHYVVLKDVFYYGYSYRYIGYIDEKQLSWLEKDLSGIKPGSTVIVALHIPTIYGESKEADSYSTLMSNSVMNRSALFKILSPFNVHILSGHSHTQWNTVISPSLFEHTHVAACATWWQGEIGVDGTPKGYTVYLVNGDSLSWYFKGVNLDKNDQFRLYSVGSDLKYPGYIIANVYNYDPAWTVNWYENGVLMGKMERYWGDDPLAKSLYPPGKNKKYSWLEVEETHHLFKAKIQNLKSKITVKVTDRFGYVYEKGIN